jgi:hypothetical protein
VVLFLEEVLWKAGVVDAPHSWVVHLWVVELRVDRVDRVDLVVVDGLERRRVPGGLTEKEAKVRAIKRSRSFAKTQREALCDLGWWSRHLASASWTGSRAVNWSDERPVVFCSDASGDLGWGFHRMTPDGGIDVDAPRGQYWDSAEWTTTQAREWEGNMLVKEMYPLVAAARRRPR